LRLGMAFGGEVVIRYLDKVKYPYNINTASQEIALQAMENVDTVNDWIKLTVQQRDWLSQNLRSLPITLEVFPSDANFVLARIKEPVAVYQYLANQGIIVRDRSKVILCDNCLRITVGKPGENQQLIEALKAYSS
jgi:histidinol-phosphate aminotransferase